MKQTKHDFDGMLNDKNTLTATIGCLEIQLSTLQKAHQNTLERLTSVEGEQKSLQDCLAAKEKELEEKIVCACHY